MPEFAGMTEVSRRSLLGRARITAGGLAAGPDFYATHEALRMRSARDGSGVRRVELYDYSGTASLDQIVTRLGAAITPATHAVR